MDDSSHPTMCWLSDSTRRAWTRKASMAKATVGTSGVSEQRFLRGQLPTAKLTSVSPCRKREHSDISDNSMRVRSDNVSEFRDGLSAHRLESQSKVKIYANQHHSLRSLSTNKKIGFMPLENTRTDKHKIRKDKPEVQAQMHTECFELILNLCATVVCTAMS